MAGYSGKPLAQRTGIRAGHRVALVDAPPGLADTRAPLPSDVTGGVGRRLGLATGPVAVKRCAVDAVGSGLDFLHRRVTT